MTRPLFPAAAMLAAALLALGAGCGTQARVTTFAECVNAGYPVMESSPRQCRADGQVFVEEAPAPAPNPAPTSGETPTPTPAEDKDTNGTNGATYGQPVTLKTGATAVFEDNLKVTLQRLDDSRCPKNVVCIWAGEISGTFRVEGGAGGSPMQEFRLGTQTIQNLDLGNRRIRLASASETGVTIVVTKE